MIRKSPDDYHELDDNDPVWDSMMMPDWKELSPDLLEEIVDALDSLGIDVVYYDTESDNYAFRFESATKRTGTESD